MRDVSAPILSGSNLWVSRTKPVPNKRICGCPEQARERNRQCNGMVALAKLTSTLRKRFLFR